MKAIKAFFLGAVLVLIPSVNLYMCVEVIVTLHDYGYHYGYDPEHILRFISVAVLSVLSFLLISKIYAHTGWVFGCGVSGV
ncbi:iron transporter [Helicobacter sp. L8]|uniref:iron transporter n=1 Tax=Helicobacter sp. L8 TaxID=2316078 RepID=UPI001F0916C3|nr:iron transporter [Helicobacter sp. L8]